MDSAKAKARGLGRALKGLEGKECWSAGGVKTGSMVSLQFGRKIARPVPLPNPHLSLDEQRFDGEIGLFIQFAAWRLDSSLGVMCSSTSSDHAGGPKQTGLDLLLGRRVRSVHVSQPGLDLAIQFDWGLWLRVFCDQTSTVDDYDNYSVHLRDRVYAVGIFSRIKCEKHGAGQPPSKRGQKDNTGSSGA